MRSKLPSSHRPVTCVFTNKSNGKSFLYIQISNRPRVSIMVCEKLDCWVSKSSLQIKTNDQYPVYLTKISRCCLTWPHKFFIYSLLMLAPYKLFKQFGTFPCPGCKQICEVILSLSPSKVISRGSLWCPFSCRLLFVHFAHHYHTSLSLGCLLVMKCDQPDSLCLLICSVRYYLIKVFCVLFCDFNFELQCDTGLFIPFVYSLMTSFWY